MFTLRPAREIRTNALAFSPDGTRLATCGEKGDGRIWDLAQRKPAAGFSTGRRSNDEIFFGAGGKEVFVLTRPARLLAWDVETRGWRHLGGRVLGIIPLPGGERALCDHDQSLSLRVLDTFAPVWTYDLVTEEDDHSWRAAAIACSGDGQRVACAHVCGRLSLLDAANGELLLRLDDTGGARYGPRALALAPDGRAAAWCAASNLFFLPLPDGPRVHHRLGRTHFLAIAWHPGGAFFATVNGDGKVDFWDAATGQRRESFEWGTGKLRGIAFDASGDRAACCAESGEIVVWDVDQ